MLARESRKTRRSDRRGGLIPLGPDESRVTETADLPLVHKRIAPRASSDGPAPAVFVLHGRGADETDLLPVAQRLPGKLDIVSLRAPDRLMGGYTWYDLDLSAGGLHGSQPDAEDFRRSLTLVDESVGRAVDAYDLDEDRLGLFGFSQGAIMSLALLLESPSRYAWCVGLHGYLPSSHAELDPAGIDGNPVFLGAGSADQVIPASRAERAADRLGEIGYDVEYAVYETAHGIGPDELEAVVAWVEQRVC